MAVLVIVAGLIVTDTGHAEIKTDIKGISPGMRLADVQSIIAAKKVSCRPMPYYGFDAVLCDLGDGDLIYHPGKFTQIIYRVDFLFKAAASAAEIASNLQSQLGVKFTRPKQENIEEYTTTVGDVDFLFTRRAGSEPTYMITIKKPALEKAEEKAQEDKARSAKPVPRL